MPSLPTTDAADARPISARDLRDALGHFATGVTVITAVTDDGPAGMAVNSFSSVSLDPPLVLFCAAKTSSTWPHIRKAGSFCANVLSANQEEFAQRFATKDIDRFRSTPFRHGVTGAPLLEDALALVECVIDEEHDAGDHTIVVGRVVALAQNPGPAPLVFYKGRYSGVQGEGVSQHVVATMNRQVRQALDALPPDLDPWKKITAAIGAHVELVMAMRQQMHVIVGNLGDAPPQIREAVREEERAYGDLWNGLLAAARETGDMDPSLSMSAARHLILGSLNTIPEWFNEERGTSAEVVRAAQQILVSGLRQPG